MEWAPHESLPSIPPSVVRRRVRPEGEVVPLRGGAQVVEDDTGLDAGDPTHRVQIHDPIEVARYVDDDGRVGRLTGQTGAAATERDGGVVFGADADDGGEVVSVERPYDTNRELAVVGRIGRVERPVAGSERDFAPDRGAEIGLEGGAARGGSGGDCSRTHPASIPGSPGASRA